SRLWSSPPATKTLSPQTIGELVPIFGMGFFQATVSGVQVQGAFLCGAMPCPRGPRKVGQEEEALSGAGTALVSATGLVSGFVSPAGFVSAAGLGSAGLVSEAAAEDVSGPVL